VLGPLRDEKLIKKTLTSKVNGEIYKFLRAAVTDDLKPILENKAIDEPFGTFSSIPLTGIGVVGSVLTTIRNGDRVPMEMSPSEALHKLID